MASAGKALTDVYIYRIEKKIKEVYEEAEKDIDVKLQEFVRKFKIKDAIYQEKLLRGEITQKEYGDWLNGQIFQGKQWKDKKRQIAEVLYNANTIAAKIANDQKGNVFVDNANYQAYLLEHRAGLDFGFNLYDSATVVKLIATEPQVLPYYTPKKQKDIDWNMKNVTRQVTLGIIEGESLDKIAKRIARVTSSRNKNSMLTNARTGMTMAQNSGRVTRLNEAKDKGIKVHKEWMATLDGHTRWQHASLDGQKKPMDEPFVIDVYKIRYPGDPMAHPSMIYNCRCTLVGDLDDYPSEYERYDNIDGKPIKNMTYREWEKAKGKTYSKSPAEKAMDKFSQVSIGKAKSVDEVNKLLNSKGLFLNRTVANLSGCDLDSAKAVASAYEQVFRKYPKLKGKFAAPNAHPIGMKDSTYAWCYTRLNGGVEVNPFHFSNWSKLMKSYEHDVESGWHPYGTTAESIVTHEIGHAIDGLLAREGVLGGITASGEYRYASSSLKNTIIKRAAKKDEIIGGRFDIWGWDKETTTSVVREWVSEYATKNNKEWFAECFAEYITSANPRIVASEFGLELEKLIGRLP